MILSVMLCPAVAAKNEERLSSPQGSPESVSASDMATALESLLHCIKDEGMDPQKTMAKFEVCSFPYFIQC